MKDSGVEWLGEIPAHWEVKRLRHIVRHFEQGWSPDFEYREANEPAELNGPRSATVRSVINRGTFQWSLNGQGFARRDASDPIPEDVARPYLLQDGDLLYGHGVGRTVGKTCWLRFEASWGRAPIPAGYADQAYFASSHRGAVVALFIVTSSKSTMLFAD